MSISAQTQVLLLLTGRFGDEAGCAPLDPHEWTRLTNWLKKNAIPVASLLDADAADRLGEWSDAAAPIDRIVPLLSRRPALADAAARWREAGIWAIGRTDADYPKRLKRRLRADAPAVLFGCGERALLNQGGIAMVAGDDATGDTTDFAQRFAGLAAATGLATIGIQGGSRGGSRGGAWSGAIEAAAQRGSLAQGGQAIALLPHGLMQGVAAGTSDTGPRLVLVSTGSPDATDGGEAGAEDCLYGLADAALLLDVEREGTRWPGATRALERDWVPLWVRGSDRDSQRLLRLGAHGLPQEAPPRTLLSPPRPELGLDAARAARLEPGGFDAPLRFPMPAPGPTLVGFAEAQAAFGAGPSKAAPDEPAARTTSHLRLVPTAADRETGAPPAAARRSSSLFDAFLLALPSVLPDHGLEAEEIAEQLALTLQQTRIWLRHAVREGRLRVDPVTGRHTPTR